MLRKQYPEGVPAAEPMDALGKQVRDYIVSGLGYCDATAFAHALRTAFTDKKDTPGL